MLYRLFLLALVIFLYGITPSEFLSARELPSESTLPGRKRAQQQPPRKNLPPESALPGVKRLPVQAKKKLPGESELPKSMLAQKAPPITPPTADSFDDLQVPSASPSDVTPEQQGGVGGPPGAPPPIGLRPVGQPWLRLNMDGHTGIVRTLSFTRDGNRICSGGDDKALEVWVRAEAAGGQSTWIHERAIRWQVHRGPRGRIHAAATGPKFVAIAGHGAMGGLGEILLLDAVSGELRQILIDHEKGHRQPVLSMSFAPNAPALASLDISGRAVLWLQDAQTGLWAAHELSASDRDRYGEEKAQLLAGLRLIPTPITMAGDNHVVLPFYVKHVAATGRPEGIATWQLERIHIQNMQREVLPTVYYGNVTALAASQDGRRIASADYGQNLTFWNAAAKTQPKSIRQNVAVLSLSFSKDGQTLAAGTGRSSKRENMAAVQLWDVRDMNNPRLVRDTNVPDHVFAVSLAPDANSVAYAQNASVMVQNLGQRGATQTLQGRARPVLRVAFAAKDPLYRIAFGSRISADGSVKLERSFHLGDVKLEALPQLQERDWVTPNSGQGTWSVRTVRDGASTSFWLFNGNKQAARLPLTLELHGRPSAECWIPDREGKPFAVAVGTSLQNNIYIFRLTENRVAPVLRQFRGHEGAVRSISMSGDRRYLVSGADDATIRVWNLEGFDAESALINSWGAEFEIQNNELVVTNIREDGPLFFRGVRSGDAVRSIRWMESKKVQTAEQPEAILAGLSRFGIDTQVSFEFGRRDMVQPRFQMLPAWQQLAALFVAENREWAFWTPAGYYDASFDGHKLFGWQVNRGVELLPEFFLAAQFQQALERPQVMSRLLSEGSLDAAFRAAQQPAPGDAQNAVIDQYRLKPRVVILAPDPDEVIDAPVTKVRAAITVRDGLQLTPPKAFANGVAATNLTLVSEQPVAGGKETIYEWDAALPADPRCVIQVVASTEASAVDTQSLVVQRKQARPSRPAKMYIVAAGINSYRDSQIQQLDFAVTNAQSVVERLRNRSADLYSSEATLLLDDQATRPLWTVVTRSSAERLRQEAQPDDLLIFFLSGHGVRDEQTQRYYFVTADTRFEDVKAGRYSSCLSFDDFAAFADVPCRKLVVLDTCHSGAIQQPLRQQDLKAALRALQSDVVFTMTASEGSQEAAEAKEKRLGRFTARLLEALDGAADQTTSGGDGNGVVTFNEAYNYVSAAVRADSAQDAQVQYPTAGPIDLLDYAVVPLTRTTD